MLLQPQHKVSLVVMDTWYGAQWSLKNQVRNNPTSPFLLAQLEKAKILKMSNFCRNICQSYHKNNVTHHPFPHHTQLTVHGVRKELAVAFIDEVNVVSLLCQKAGKAVPDGSSPQGYSRPVDAE